MVAMMSPPLSGTGNTERVMSAARSAWYKVDVKKTPALPTPDLLKSKLGQGRVVEQKWNQLHPALSLYPCCQATRPRFL